MSAESPALGAVADDLRRVLESLESLRQSLKSQYDDAAARSEAGDDQAAVEAGDLFRRLEAVRRVNNLLLNACARAQIEQGGVENYCEEIVQREIAEIDALSASLESFYRLADKRLNEAGKALKKAEAVRTQLANYRTLTGATRRDIRPDIAAAIAAAGSPELAGAVELTGTKPTTLLDQLQRVRDCHPMLDRELHQRHSETNNENSK